MEKIGVGDDVLIDDILWDMGFNDSRILLENRGICGVVVYGKNWHKNLENI